jgi:hypothetical protein
MSNFLSEEACRCRRKAEECAHKAAAQSDPKLRQDFLKLEESWLSLARSFAYHESQSDPSKKQDADATTATYTLPLTTGFVISRRLYAGVAAHWSSDDAGGKRNVCACRLSGSIVKKSRPPLNP